MNPELTGLAIVVLVLVVILSTWYGRARKRPQGPDVGTDIFIDPEVDQILAALAYTDPTEHEQVDQLLDRLNAARASWPSI